MTTSLASRVMKARHRSRCALCPAVVMIGQQIGRITGGVWAHTGCIIIARNGELASIHNLMTEPPRPGRFVPADEREDD